MSQSISIYRNGIWAGKGTIKGGDIECAAVLGATQDDSDETYDSIVDAIGDGQRKGSITRPDGEYTWEIE